MKATVIDRAGRLSGRQRAGIHEQRLQEKPAQLVCPDLKRPASHRKLKVVTLCVRSEWWPF
jgi:hypothetical protein